MSSSKIAISVPGDILAAVDAAAKERGESRRQFNVVCCVPHLRARRDTPITRQLDELFMNEDVLPTTTPHP